MLLQQRLGERTEPEVLFTLKQAEGMLGVSRRTLLRMRTECGVHGRVFPSKQGGMRTYLSGDDIVTLKRSRNIKPALPALPAPLALPPPVVQPAESTAEPTSADPLAVLVEQMTRTNQLLEEIKALLEKPDTKTGWLGRWFGGTNA